MLQIKYRYLVTGYENNVNFNKYFRNVNRENICLIV